MPVASRTSSFDGADAVGSFQGDQQLYHGVLHIVSASAPQSCRRIVAEACGLRALVSLRTLLRYHERRDPMRREPLEDRDEVLNGVR